MVFFMFFRIVSWVWWQLTNPSFSLSFFLYFQLCCIISTCIVLFTNVLCVYIYIYIYGFLSLSRLLLRGFSRFSSFPTKRVPTMAMGDKLFTKFYALYICVCVCIMLPLVYPCFPIDGGLVGEWLGGCWWKASEQASFHSVVGELIRGKEMFLSWWSGKWWLWARKLFFFGKTKMEKFWNGLFYKHNKSTLSLTCFTCVLYVLVLHLTSPKFSTLDSKVAFMWRSPKSQN